MISCRGLELLEDYRVKFGFFLLGCLMAYFVFLGRS